MFADIVGFTALMEEDETHALGIRDRLKRKLESEVILHGGRIIKFSGDGALCSFESASECVRAALAVQTAMQEDPKIPLRIGIHQADVVFEESDVHGDGVNIASRLESFAVPGSIFISAKVHDDIKNQKDIQAVSLGKYLLKNVKEPVEIYAISNPGLSVPHKIKLEGKGKKFTEHKSHKRLIRRLAFLILLLVVLALLGFFFVRPWTQKQYARNELLPGIQKLINENSRPPTAAFDLGLEAEKYIPDDSALIKLWPVIATTISVQTEPNGAEVLWKDYNRPDADWRSAGITPLKNIRFPRSYLRMQIKKTGYQTIEYAGPMTYERLGKKIAHLKLDPEGSLPENMVRIPRDTTEMYIVGLEGFGPKKVDEFLIDKYEVTNKQFKAFMDAGGYANKSFWNYPVFTEGKEIPLSSAMALFVDRTGRQGPATWEAGTYPDGQENYPVTGVSWYEAAAYAAWAKKKLPTIFHWSVVAETSRTEFIVPLSNFNGKSTTPVGSLPGYSSFGIYDVAGNVREWCFNQTNDPGKHYILGGGWNDPTYAFNDGYSQPAMDRSVSNGFRCMQDFPGDSNSISLTRSVTMAFRDYHKEKPVDDKTFAIFLRQYEYDKTPLNARIDSTVQGESWTAEKISFDAAYNNERMEVWLYLPKNGKKPYQTIIFFPGSGDIYAKHFDPSRALYQIDFILKNGRALVYPIYKGTWERYDGLKNDLQEETVFYKDHVIMWRKDIGRTMDYLQTRNDIQSDKIGLPRLELGWIFGRHHARCGKKIQSRCAECWRDGNGKSVARS